MSNVVLLDAAGRRRSPACTPDLHAGRPPRNKGRRYPADPPKIQEIVAVMRAAGDSRRGRRLRALTVILWRAGLRPFVFRGFRVRADPLMPACPTSVPGQ